MRQAFVIGREFLEGGPACLILGDNIFYGHGLGQILRRAAALKEGASVFGYRVNNPQRYGVVEFSADQRVLSLEEKPREPKSDWAVMGLYFYDSQVTELAATLRPSHRGELEITDLNNLYLQQGQLAVELLGRGIAWLDTGTHDSLLEAGNFIEVIEKRQGLKVACLEEIAYRWGFIDADQVMAQAHKMKNTEYSEYLKRVVAEKRPG